MVRYAPTKLLARPRPCPSPVVKLSCVLARRMMGTVSIGSGGPVHLPQTNMRQYHLTPKAGPERPGAARLHPRSRTWEVPPRWPILAVPLFAIGATVGIALYLAIHSAQILSTTSTLQPPAALRAFGWPLRLQQRVNVLVIGIDSTIDEHRRVLPYSRSDALMLVSFDPQQRRITGVSIPRDSYAQIPGAPPQKINAAYALGGPRLTVQTVENLLGVPVPYYIKLGAASFARIVTALGGIEVDVEKDMSYVDTWADLHINLKKGRQLLSGEQVVQYIRFRNDLESDIGRVRRQQQVLRAILHKLKSPATVLAAPRLLQAVRKNTQTNLSATDLLTLGLFTMRRSGEEIRTTTLPGEMGPIYVILDEGQMQKMVANLFIGVDVKLLSSTGVEVLNGSGIPGLARLTATRLERLGFRIVRIDTAAQVATTTVINHRGRPDVARALANLLGQPQASYAPGRNADITVVVAQDLRPFYPVLVSGQQTPAPGSPPPEAAVSSGLDR